MMQAFVKKLQQQQQQQQSLNVEYAVFSVIDGLQILMACTQNTGSVLVSSVILARSISAFWPFAINDFDSTCGLHL